MLLTGSSVVISWKDDFNDDVKIEIYRNGVYTQTITDTVSGSNSYQWVIPDSFASGFDYRIRVISITNEERFDESDSNLIIMHQPRTAPYVQDFDAFKEGNKVIDSWEQIVTDDIDWTVIKGPTPFRKLIRVEPEHIPIIPAKMEIIYMCTLHHPIIPEKPQLFSPR